MEFNKSNPNGKYDLDLSNSEHARIAKQLLDLAREQGADVWKFAFLNDQPFLLKSKASVTVEPIAFERDLDKRKRNHLLGNSGTRSVDCPIRDFTTTFGFGSSSF